MSTRLSVNVNDETATALRYLAERHDTTVTEQVRRAVSIYHFFHERQAGGERIQLVTHGRRKHVTEVMIP